MQSYFCVLISNVEINYNKLLMAVDFGMFAYLVFIIFGLPPVTLLAQSNKIFYLFYLPVIRRDVTVVTIQVITHLLHKLKHLKYLKYLKYFRVLKYFYSITVKYFKVCRLTITFPYQIGLKPLKLK